MKHTKKKGTLQYTRESLNRREIKIKSKRRAGREDLNDKTRVKSEDHYVSREDTQWPL